MTQKTVRAIFSPWKLIALSIMLLTALTPYASADTLLTITTAQILSALPTATGYSAACTGTGIAGCAIYDFAILPNVDEHVTAATFPTGWTATTLTTGGGSSTARNAEDFKVLLPGTGTLSLISPIGLTGTGVSVLSGTYTISQLAPGSAFTATFNTSNITSYTITASMYAINTGGTLNTNKPASLSFAYTATPEPTSAMLLLGGLAAVLGLRGKQRRSRLAARAK